MRLSALAQKSLHHHVGFSPLFIDFFSLPNSLLIYYSLGFKSMEHFGPRRIQLAIRGLVRVPNRHRGRRG